MQLVPEDDKLVTLQKVQMRLLVYSVRRILH